MSQKVYEVLVDRIIAKMEEGVVPWQHYARGERSQNFKSRKPYRGLNAMVTGMSGYKCPYWLSFKQVREMGGTVRKGEHGTPIVFHVFEEGLDGARDIYRGARYYLVWNLEQVEGIAWEAPKCVASLDGLNFDGIERSIAIKGKAPCEIRKGGTMGFYKPSEDFIQVPRPVDCRSYEEYFAVVFHEMVHSTGHKSRLDRKTLNTIAAFGDHSYSEEELIAEIGAAYLCAEAGISNAVIDNQVAYLDHWLKKLRGDKMQLVRAAREAQKATDLILGVNFSHGE